MEAMQTVTDILAQRAREADNYIISLNNRRLDLAVQDICKFNVHLATRNNKPAEPAAVKPAQPRYAKKITRKRWAKTDDEKISQLRKMGLSTQVIAKNMGRTAAGITNREARLRQWAKIGVVGIHGI